MRPVRKTALMIRAEAQTVSMLDELAAKHHSTRSRMANWLLERGVEVERNNLLLHRGFDAKGSEVAV